MSSLSRSRSGSSRGASARLLLLPVLCLLPGLAAGGSSAPAPTGSLLIRGGEVLDGAGSPPRRADLRIQGGRILEIGALRPRDGETVLSARDRIVAPGFIDAHSHADGGMMEAPDLESQVRQGITTAILGQDGGSQFPLRRFWEQVRQRRPALNLASFVGHGTVRREALPGDPRRKASESETARMAALVGQEMEAGALGLSTGLEYDPGYFAETDEVIALARVAARNGGSYISHIRNEDNMALESIRELIRIAETARLPAQISHIKLGSRQVWGKAPQVIAEVEAANRRGARITADLYPYLYWQSTLTLLNPSRNWEDRGAWERGLSDIGGPERVLLARYTPDATWVGQTVAQLAARTRRDPVSVIQEIVQKTRGPGATGSEAVVVTAMEERDLRTFLATPWIMLCSDGGPRSPHPRSAGSYPRVLGRYVRDEKVLPLQEAVRKMTSFPAAHFGLRERGELRPGWKADVVVFDAEAVRDTATTQAPKARPEGIHHVVVNGVPVLQDGVMTGARPGLPLRRGE
ncbi:MAG: D-aminoacylase [Armatimonadetes bacterium]|nr:D-aminoacylase [Armatimonadota bacterium]